ncbi:hypothetical protein B0H17DRAFT_1030065 [Mycena rosella]|uniref:Uncharacterized protein n=1 Tax=Mycena rosella TaxID=1033263 RepID=A0AAD7H1Z6_MYCRO|nr:hypothetical protein B0H17DRAFT_1030065 [Mycena rosella]
MSQSDEFAPRCKALISDRPAFCSWFATAPVCGRCCRLALTCVLAPDTSNLGCSPCLTSKVACPHKLSYLFDFTKETFFSSRSDFDAAQENLKVHRPRAVRHGGPQKLIPSSVPVPVPIPIAVPIPIPALPPLSLPSISVPPPVSAPVPPILDPQVQLTALITDARPIDIFQRKPERPAFIPAAEELHSLNSSSLSALSLPDLLCVTTTLLNCFQTIDGISAFTFLFVGFICFFHRPASPMSSDPSSSSSLPEDLPKLCLNTILTSHLKLSLALKVTRQRLLLPPSSADVLPPYARSALDVMFTDAESVLASMVGVTDGYVRVFPALFPTDLP